MALCCDAVDDAKGVAAPFSFSSSPRLENDERCGGGSSSTVVTAAAAMNAGGFGCSNGGPSLSLSLWDIYKNWARRHRTMLWSADDAVSRLLFFFCHYSNANNNSSPSSNSWREIIWGLLELHRFALHRATLVEDDNNHEPGHHWFGTTVEVTTPSGSTASSYIPAIRCALTILQTLHPILERVVSLSSTPSSSSGDNDPRRTKSMSLWNVRRLLERTRFLLRLALLLQYWQALPVMVSPGLLRNGGGMAAHDHEDSYSQVIITTAEQEMARLQVVNYVGKRSGKRLFGGNGGAGGGDDGGGSGKKTSIDDTTVLLKWRIKVAELLYIGRPLLYTEWQGGSSQQQPSKPWAVALLMDVASLWGLQPVGGCHENYTNNNNNNKSGRRRGRRGPINKNNVASRQEWERRQMRLLLYLLRSPVWERYTEPLAQRVGTSLQKSVPLLGNLLQCCFWDWLYHWKEYRLEEG